MSQFASFKRLVLCSGIWLDASLAFLFQTNCVACRDATATGALCSRCVRFSKVDHPLCQRCGISLPIAMQRCGVCRTKPRSPLLQIRSLWWLDDAAKALLHWVKYGGNLEGLHRIYPQFKLDFDFAFESGLYLVPIPLVASRWLNRGFNQSDLLCDWLAWNAAGRVLIDGLIKNKKTSPQSLLSAKERIKNVQESFIWNTHHPVPEAVAIVDDVYTTGNTLEAAAKALARAGVKRIYGWTLFRTPLK